MTTNNVRAFIAIAMVVVFIGLTAVMALFPLFSSKNVEIKDYADFFVKIASVYTGILGVIVGITSHARKAPDLLGPTRRSRDRRVSTPNDSDQTTLDAAVRSSGLLDSRQPPQARSLCP